MSTNNELTKALELFIQDKNLEGAFYIDGPWGCGKSFYIESFLEKEKKKNPKKKNIYISLNGLKDINEVRKQIIEQCHPNWTKVINSKAAKLIIPIVKGASSYFNIESSNFDELINNLENFLENNSNLIIFDDFERTRIDLQELFAFITSLCAKGIKVVLIGNEIEVIRYLQTEEMFKHKVIASNISNSIDEFKTNLEQVIEPVLYLSIKEKSISKTYYMQFDSSIFFDEIVKRFKKSIRQIILKNKATIKRIFEKYNCSNFRTCIFAISKYEEAIDRIPKHFLKSSLTKECLLFNAIIFSIIYKNNCSTIFDEKEYFGDVIVYPIHPLKEFVEKSVWIEKDLLDCIDDVEKETKRIMDISKPNSLIILDSRWIYMTDDELTKAIGALVEDIKNGNVPFNYYHRSLYSLCSYIYGYKFEPAFSLNDICKIMVDHIKSSAKYVELDDDFLTFTKPYESAVMYHNELTEVSLIRNQQLTKEKINKAITNSLLDDINLLANQSRSNRCFFSSIDTKSLIDYVEKCSTSDIMEIRKTISSVYSFSNLYAFYPDDLDNVDKTIKQLKALTFDSKIKCVAVSWLINDLEGYKVSLSINK